MVKQATSNHLRLNFSMIFPANNKLIAAAAFWKVVISATLARPTLKLLLIGPKNKPIVLTNKPKPTKEIKQQATKTHQAKKLECDFFT